MCDSEALLVARKLGNSARGAGRHEVRIADANLAPARFSKIDLNPGLRLASLGLPGATIFRTSGATPPHIRHFVRARRIRAQIFETKREAGA